MVIKIAFQHIFKYPVEIVAQTHLTKYPNEKEKNVVEMVTVEKKHDKNGVEYHRRIATCLNVIPDMLRRIAALNVKQVYIEEEAWLDRQRRTLTLKSHNITWSEYAHLWEESVFRPVRENPHWTLFEQNGVIDVHGIGPLGRVIELFVERFMKHGIQKSLTLMNEIMKEKVL